MDYTRSEMMAFIPETVEGGVTSWMPVTFIARVLDGEPMPRLRGVRYLVQNPFQDPEAGSSGPPSRAKILRCRSFAVLNRGPSCNKRPLTYSFSLFHSRRGLTIMVSAVRDSVPPQGYPV